jgi:hypothetical protein
VRDPKTAREVFSSTDDTRGEGGTFASLPLIRFFASQKLRRSYVIMALFKLYRKEAGVAFHEPGMTLVACKIDSHV